MRISYAKNVVQSPVSVLIFPVRDGDALEEELLYFNPARLRRNGILLFEVGSVYAVQSEITKPAIGRVQVLYIRRCRLQEADIIHTHVPPCAFCEGTGKVLVPSNSWRVCPHCLGRPFEAAFAREWDVEHPAGQQWADSPEVWEVTIGQVPSEPTSGASIVVQVEK